MAAKPPTAVRFTFGKKARDFRPGNGAQTYQTDWGERFTALGVKKVDGAVVVHGLRREVTMTQPIWEISYSRSGNNNSISYGMSFNTQEEMHKFIAKLGSGWTVSFRCQQYVGVAVGNSRDVPATIPVDVVLEE